jgi:hypothetical protein
MSRLAHFLVVTQAGGLCIMLYENLVFVLEDPLIYILRVSALLQFLVFYKNT